MPFLRGFCASLGNFSESSERLSGSIREDHLSLVCETCRLPTSANSDRSTAEAPTSPASGRNRLDGLLWAGAACENATSARPHSRCRAAVVLTINMMPRSAPHWSFGRTHLTGSSETIRPKSVAIMRGSHASKERTRLGLPEPPRSMCRSDAVESYLISPM